jgi:pyruvate carboxylase subunit B
MSDVVRKGGYGTSVTPVSQFYFQQAFNNVMFGPWKKIAEPYGQMVLGYFGKTPVPPDPDVVKLAEDQLGLKPTTQSVLERNDADPKKGIAAARAVLEAEGLPVTDENIFIAAACKDKGIAFLKGEATTAVRKIDTSPAETPTPAPSAPSSGPAEYTVSVNGQEYFMAFEGNTATVNGKVYRVGLQNGFSKTAAPRSSHSSAGVIDITSQMPGLVHKLLVSVGDRVREGQTVLILEAMKMEMEVSAHASGVIADIRCTVGDQVTTGQTLATIRE